MVAIPGTNYDPDKYDPVPPPWYGEGQPGNMLPAHGWVWDEWGEKGPTGSATTISVPAAAQPYPPIAGYDPAAANGNYGGTLNMHAGHGLLHHRFTDASTLTDPYPYDVAHAYDSYEFDVEAGNP